MSFDVQFISLVDSLQVLEAVEVTGATPRAISLRAAGGLFNAQRVLINDYGVDTFSVVDDRHLVVRPPAVFDSLTVAQMNFVVVSGAYTGSASAQLVFGLTKHVRKVDGLQKLVQQVVKTLLSRDGGNLLQVLGATFRASDRSRIAAAVAQGVSTTEEKVRAAQDGASGIATSERLLSLRLSDVAFYSEVGEVRARIRLVTFTGNSVEFPLTL